MNTSLFLALMMAMMTFSMMMRMMEMHPRVRAVLSG
jgi:hypothetical protein